MPGTNYAAINVESTLAMMRKIGQIADEYESLKEAYIDKEMELAMVNAMNAYLLFEADSHNARYEILSTMIQENAHSRLIGFGRAHTDWRAECNRRLKEQGYEPFDFL